MYTKFGHVWGYGQSAAVVLLPREPENVFLGLRRSEFGHLADLAKDGQPVKICLRAARLT